jgi:hypothetical protein
VQWVRPEEQRAIEIDRELGFLDEDAGTFDQIGPLSAVHNGVSADEKSGNLEQLEGRVASVLKGRDPRSPHPGRIGQKRERPEALGMVPRGPLGSPTTAASARSDTHRCIIAIVRRGESLDNVFWTTRVTESSIMGDWRLSTRTTWRTCTADPTQGPMAKR